MFVSPKKITQEIISATKLLSPICERIIKLYIQKRDVDLVIMSKNKSSKLSILFEDGEIKEVSPPRVLPESSLIRAARCDKFYFVMIETKCYEFHLNDELWVRRANFPLPELCRIKKLVSIKDKIYMFGSGYVPGGFFSIYMSYQNDKWTDLNTKLTANIKFSDPLFWNEEFIHMGCISEIKTINLSTFEVKDIQYPEYRMYAYNIMHNGKLYLFQFDTSATYVMQYTYDGEKWDEMRIDLKIKIECINHLYSNNSLIYLIQTKNYKWDVLTYNPLNQEFLTINSFECDYYI